MGVRLDHSALLSEDQGDSPAEKQMMVRGDIKKVLTSHRKNKIYVIRFILLYFSS